MRLQNMNKLKLILLAIFSSFALLFAQDYKAGFSADARVIAENLGEGEGFTSPDVDDLTLKFSASVDNVSAYVEFDDNGDEALAFDGAQMTVSDLFDGLLTVNIFDIDFAKGDNKGLLPDAGFNGIKFHIKPIDILSFYVGYGVKNITFGGAVKGAIGLVEAANAQIDADLPANPTDEQKAQADEAKAANYATVDGIFAGSGTARDGDNLKSDIHAITVGANLSLEVIDAELHFGMFLFDNAPQYVKDGATFDQLSGGTGFEDNAIALANIGVGVDALKFLSAGLLKIEFGAAITGAYTTDVFRSYKSAVEDQKASQEILYQVTAYGDSGDIADTGFGVSYRLVYAGDNPANEHALGDLKELDDDTYADMFELKVTPYYSISQFTFKLPIEFSMVGENVVYDLYNSKEFTNFRSAVNTDGDESSSIMNLEFEPTIVWTPASGMSAEFYANIGLNDLGGELEPEGESKDYDNFATDIELGMRLKVAFDLAGS